MRPGSICDDVKAVGDSVSSRRPQCEHVVAMLGCDGADRCYRVARGLHQLVPGALQAVGAARGGARPGSPPRLRQPRPGECHVHVITRKHTHINT